MADEKLDVKSAWADRIERARRRKRHADEILTALESVRSNPSPASARRLHELHAEHEREHGHDDTAALAEKRAERAEHATRNLSV